MHYCLPSNIRPCFSRLEMWNGTAHMSAGDHIMPIHTTPPQPVCSVRSFTIFIAPTPPLFKCRIYACQTPQIWSTYRLAPHLQTAAATLTKNIPCRRRSAKKRCQRALSGTYATLCLLRSCARSHRCIHPLSIQRAPLPTYCREAPTPTCPPPYQHHDAS